MSRWMRRAVVPAYILLCVLLGGSRQGPWMNAALQLLALLLLAWLIVAPSREAPATASRQLLMLCAGGIAILLLQLIPLPPDVWISLPGRESVAQGYQLLGYELPALPLSLAPDQSLDAIYTLLPPLAVLALLVTRRGEQESWIAAAVVAGALANVLLGAIQVASGSTGSWAYLYDITNKGAVGFFANRNHMATLLLAAIPFAAALFASRTPGGRIRGKAFALATLGGGGFLLVLAGLLLNDSLAALALAVPVIALSAMILPAGWRFRRLILPLAGIGLIVAVVGVGSSSVRSELESSASVASEHVGRGAIWEGTVQMIEESWPAGTGFGTFPQIYALQENPAETQRTYINHAHNDYLEIVLEGGAPALLVLLLFLIWWAWHSLRVWRSPFSTQFARAATLASAAILAHSIVDYPLRTAAVAAVFAACLAMIARSPATVPGRGHDGPRHIRIA